MKKKIFGTRKLIVAITFSLLILIISKLLSGIIAGALLVINVPAFICNIIAEILYIAFSYLLLKVLCRKFLKFTIEEFGIPRFGIKLRWLCIAFLLPLSVSISYFCISGKFESSGMKTMEILQTLSNGIFMGLSSGIVEEMVFRGIIMNSLYKRYNKSIAIIVPSVLFGFAHIIGMNFNTLSCLLVIVAGTLVGIMFSLIAMDENSIWNSALVHAVWNIIIIGRIISIGTSVDKNSIYSYILNSKSVMITGGEFGIESSIIAVIGYTIVIGLAYYYSISKKHNN